MTEIDLLIELLNDIARGLEPEIQSLTFPLQVLVNSIFLTIIRAYLPSQPANSSGRNCNADNSQNLE